MSHRSAPAAQPGLSEPTYTLHCRSATGAQVQLLYRPHTSQLTNAFGDPMLRDEQPYDFEAIEPVSPTTPGWKSRNVHTLKIQLGMACNYSCSYCNQASHAHDATVTRTAQIDEFLDALPKWLDGTPERIEFWGGEPLLYFAKLQRLVPALRERFPATTFSMVTNGSLLDADTVDFIERWDIHVAVSHDGPGQRLRGPDPFDDPERAHWIRALWRRRSVKGSSRVTVNVVLTPANADIAATRAWLAVRFGDPDLTLDTEGVVTVYDDATLNGAGRWSPTDYDTLRHSIVEGFVTGEALRYISIRTKARDFIESLQRRRPLTALGQKCGMDEPDRLAVDLQGHVMTCQNTSAQGAHHIGNVLEMERVQLTTSTHFLHRESCNHCPVAQLCKGSCMYLEGDHFAQSCENEYQYNSAILAGVIRSVTGLDLESIEGDIRRPLRRRTIPIRAAAASVVGQIACRT